MVDFVPQNSIKNELNVVDSSFQGSAKTSMSQDIHSVTEVKYDKADLTVFFGIGMIVNIVMITSFFIWAVKQWKKNDTTKK